jgi:hypothetical protein
MKAREITEFLKELQNRRVPSKLINGWVSMPCPLAQWTHRPSFGVKVQDKSDRVSIFNCYTCKKKGPLSYLATLYQDFSGQDKSHLIDEAEDIELFGVQLPLWEERNDAEPHMLPPDPLGAEYEDIFEPAWEGIGGPDHHQYLASRGIGRDVTRTLDLRFDEDDGHGAARIIFPVRGPEGELYGYTGRAIDDNVNPRIRDYYGLPKRACLLGIHALSSRETAFSRPVALVEGLFDYARLRSYAIPAVAAMHSGLTELQAQLLRDLGRPVVLFFDNDEAGQSGQRSCWKITYPSRKSSGEGNAAAPLETPGPSPDKRPTGC